jgi:hypothetical protein
MSQMGYPVNRQIRIIHEAESATTCELVGYRISCTTRSVSQHTFLHWLTQVEWQLWKYVSKDTFDAYHLTWWHSVWWSIFPVAGISF